MKIKLTMTMSWQPFGMSGTYIRGVPAFPLTLVRSYIKIWFMPDSHRWHLT